MVTLIDAAKSGNRSQVLQALRTGHCDINCRDSEMKGTPLFWAANGGYQEIVQLLLDSGADIEISVKWRMTPLLAAVDRKHYHTAQLLLAWGANVNVQSQKGDTALHLAAYRGSIHLCKLLLAHGAITHILNSNGKTAQQEAAGAGHTAITNLLAPETSCHRVAICRSSSLPLSHHDEPTSGADWEDPKMPSESDETLLSVGHGRTSLRRQILKSALPPATTIPGVEGDMVRSHSTNQLYILGRVSPPTLLHGGTHQGSPPDRHDIRSNGRHQGSPPGSPPHRHDNKSNGRHGVEFELPVRQPSSTARHRRDRTDPRRLSLNAGTPINNHNQMSSRTQSALDLGRDPSDMDHGDLFLGNDSLLSIIERLKTDKSTLMEEKKVLEQRLERLLSLVDSTFATDTSSEESWQPRGTTGFQQPEAFRWALATQLESEQRRRESLEKVCEKLTAENYRLQTMMISPPTTDKTHNGDFNRTEGTGLSNDRSFPGHIISIQQAVPEPSRSDGFLHDAFPRSPSVEAQLTSPSSTSSSESSSSLDYPSVSEHLSSPKFSCHTESLADSGRGHRSLPGARKSFTGECWRSLNSSYLRLPSQVRMAVSTAMRVGKPEAGSGGGLLDVTKQMLQAVGGGNGAGLLYSMKGQSLDVAELESSCDITIQEKLSQVEGANRNVSATFRCVINSQPCMMKVCSLQVDKETSSYSNERDLSPHPHLHLPIGGLELSTKKGDCLRRQLLTRLRVDIVEPAYGASLRCTVYPDFRLNLGELFEYGLRVERTSAPAPAPCSEACILRILLQLLRGVECLQQEGMVHGNIRPKHVYVTDDMRIVLGGLENVRRPGDDRSSAWMNEDAPQRFAHEMPQLKAPELIFNYAIDKDPQIAKNKTIHSMDHESSDSYAIAAMLCTLLSSTDKFEHRTGKEATDNFICSPPDWLSQNFYCLLMEMLNPDLDKRPPVKAAILRVAMLLFGPRVGEVKSQADCEEWLMAQALRLLLNSPQDLTKSPPSRAYSCDDSLSILDWSLFRDFILDISPPQLWGLYQTCQAAWTNNARN